MSELRIALATIALNEIEWLPRLVAQHQDWPGLVGWVFVEASDQMYVRAAAGMVNEHGLSRDGTTGLLAQLELDNPRVRYLPIGTVANKSEARTHYLRAIDELRPDWILVLDADEFYTRHDQERILTTLAHFSAEPRPPVLLRQRHLWRPQSISAKPLLELEVVGGYWNVPHCRAWPWYPGMVYRADHNSPELEDGTQLRDRMVRLLGPGQPQCVHTGFASLLAARRAKHRYYVARGEGKRDGRQKYVDCRSAWESWRPGFRLPHGARVIAYRGPAPEVLR